MQNEQIITQLRQGAVIAYPTEAVFGLGCDPNNESAVMRLLALKQRPIEKGLILVAPHLDFLRPFICEEQMQPSHWAKLTQHYARPTTWVVPARTDTPHFLTGKFNTIAVRLCAHPAVAWLCEHAQMALTSTSANLSGQTPCRSVREVKQQFGDDFPVYESAVGGEQNPSEIRDIVINQIIRQG
ncbi:tRNA threonylcarbamoyladenosine biosynthesis protein RimN [Pasteurellaceae bacterium HPA106]|uniref:Sua5/YciO/YrdC/YwlC family protein n=1 Tax=Spirabiliibacterium pneumoniae TaxID=221400 RepID=UPI001AAC71B1|nr:Sua5/YciO/YrdC/YwlC family protein [Spirabiliibacterium pneumoniae]MBE2897010.1 tRNA threonylcarbamoyladenosine biosynthesis protein RimN [Spirabiliibacterium pneumoniae]